MKHVKSITVAKASLPDIGAILEKVPTCVDAFITTVTGAVTTLLNCILPAAE